VPAVNSFAVESALYQGYQLRLPAFEGPFDVLLRLVERSHLAITDVSLVAVTAQFLNYVGSMDHANAELIAEFSSVGSRLIVLKSRSLLPRPPVEDAESVSDLARELIEYLAVKETAQLLGERDVQGAGAFPIAGAPAPAHDRSVLRPLAAHQPIQLARALRRRLSVVPLPALIVAARKLVSLRDMAERVLSGLHHSGSSTFRSITAACVDLHETRTAFLAVLILARRQIVEVEQTELFGEINIRSGSSLRGTDSFLNSLSFED
jgi:segregation and condensation protein A